jgi:hypothetical protein
MGTGAASLPDKLDASAVRNAVRGRFGTCAAKVAGGSVIVQTSFVISSNGMVQSARISEGGGATVEVQRCIIEQIKATKFGGFRDPYMIVNLPIKLL